MEEPGVFAQDERSISAALNEKIHAHGQRIALTFVAPGGDAQNVTYANLGRDIARVHAHASACGIREGDVVVLALDHSYALARMFLGLLSLGALPVVLPYQQPYSPVDASADAVARAVESLGAAAAISVPTHVAAIRAALRQRSAVVLDATFITNGDATASTAISRRRGDDIAYLQLSSGTTRTPRAIGVTHRALLANVGMIHDIWRMTPDDVCVGWLPLHHDLGLITLLLLPLWTGARSVLLSPGHWIRRPAALLHAIDRHRGTITMMPNFAFAHAVRHIADAELRQVDLSSLKVCLNASELVYPETIRAFRDRFALAGLRPDAVKVGYGMSEAVCGVAMTLLEETPRIDSIVERTFADEHRAVPAAPGVAGSRGVVSCGRPFPSTEIRVVDEHGGALPDRAIGEIRVRGPSVCPTYVGGRTQTPIRDDAGWFATGDVGYLADGQLYVCDRKSDLINVGGRHLYPQFIEAIAAETVGALAGSAAAFGVPDERLGSEAPVLVVGLRAKPDAGRTRAWASTISDRVSREQDVRLADVHFVRRGWLCRTTSGKVSRAACRDKYRRERRTKPPVGRSGGALQDDLVRMFQETLALPHVAIDQDFFALGGDSLAALRLTLDIEERLGRELPAEAFDDLTVANLVRVLGRSAAGTQRSASSHEFAEMGEATPRRIEIIRSIGARRWIRNVMLRRGPFMGQRMLPYASGARLLAWLATRPWSGTLLFRRQVDVVHRCLSMVHDGRRDDTAVVQQSIASNVWSRWRLAALDRCGDAEFDRWVQVRGFPALDARRTAGGLMLVTSHTALTTVLGSLLRRARIGEYFSIGTHTSGPMLAQLHGSRRVLRQGGVAVIAADGGMGTSTPLVVPFFGRKRTFRTGFAELALGAGSLIVPVSVALDTAGQITVQFSEPLEAARVTHRRQMDALVLQYVDVLKQEWRSNLGSFRWEQLEEFLDLPAADQAA